MTIVAPVHDTRETIDEAIPLDRLGESCREDETADAHQAKANTHVQQTAADEESVQNDTPSTRPATIASVSASTAPLDGGAPSSSALPPTDGGVRAWTFLAAACLLEMLIWGLGTASGTFQDYHLSSPQSPLYGKSQSISAATGTLTTAGQYFSPFLFLGYLSAFPQHIARFSICALCCSVLGFVGASLYPTPATVVMLQGFVAGWSGGAFYTPAMLWLPQWFSQRIGFATGILFLGSGIGGIIWPFAISSLLSRVGFAWTLRTLALIQGILGTAIFFTMRPRLKTSRDQVGLRARRNILRAILPVHEKMVHSPLGIANSTLQFFQGAAYWSVSYYLSPYATSLGFSRTQSTALLSVLNGASALSYILTGRLCDAVPYAPLIIVIGSIGSVLVGIGLGFAKSLPALFAFTSLYGLVNGGFPCILSPIAREMAILGETEHSSVFVEVMAVRGLGGVAGPLISSALYANNAQSNIGGGSPWTPTAVYGSHGIGSVVIFATICTIIASLAASSTLPMKKRRYDR